MSRLLQLLSVMALLSLSFAAHATTDGGHSLRLLALAGPDDRFAILAQEHIQEDCTFADCTVFAVDIKAGNQRRVHEHRLPPPPTDPATGNPRPISLLKRYLSNLDKTARRHLTPVRDASKDKLLTPDVIKAIDPNNLDQIAALNHKLRFTLANKQRVQATLSHGTPFTAAAIYDRKSSTDDPSDWRECIDSKRQVAMCSSCKQITVKVNGAPRRVWSCPGLGRYSGAAKGKEACDCRAKGRITTLQLRHLSKGTIWKGSSIVAVPRAMGQNFMSNDDDITLSFGHAGFGADMKIIQSRAGLLLFGPAKHAPTANGTYIPVFVTAPLPAATAPPSSSSTAPPKLGLSPTPAPAQLTRVAWSCLWQQPAYGAALLW